jgi:predicted nucleic acid-binding protein
MSIFLLDTTVIIDALNEKKNRRLFLRELVEQGHMLACCGINVAEVYTGLRAQEEERTKALVESLEYYPITFPIAEHAGLLTRDHNRKGTTLSITDALIAAVAMYYKLTLITDNTKDFPMKEIRLYPLPRN